MISESEIDILIRNVQETLERAAGETMQAYPIQDYVDSIRNYPKYENYFGISKVVEESCERIRNTCDAHAQGLYQKLALLMLMKESLGTLRGGPFSRSVAELCMAYFDRVVEDLSKKSDNYYTHRSDSFIDDICCCSLKTLPVGGAWMIEIAAVRKRLLVTGGLRQFVRSSILFLFKLRGVKPFYRIHTLKRYSEGFTPKERERCYLRIAELLKRNPEIKGVYLLGWFYDPKLAEVSPGLAYLRETPERNGAIRFRFETSDQALRLATAWSAERQKLYNAGEYMPTEYALIWPRKEMLGWALAQPKEDETLS